MAKNKKKKAIDLRKLPPAARIKVVEGLLKTGKISSPPNTKKSSSNDAKELKSIVSTIKNKQEIESKTFIPSDFTFTKGCITCNGLKFTSKRIPAVSPSILEGIEAKFRIKVEGQTKFYFNPATDLSRFLGLIESKGIVLPDTIHLQKLKKKEFYKTLIEKQKRYDQEFRRGWLGSYRVHNLERPEWGMYLTPQYSSLCNSGYDATISTTVENGKKVQEIIIKKSGACLPLLIHGWEFPYRFIVKVYEINGHNHHIIEFLCKSPDNKSHQIKIEGRNSSIDLLAKIIKLITTTGIKIGSIYHYIDR